MVGLIALALPSSIVMMAISCVISIVALKLVSRQFFVCVELDTLIPHAA